jgi:hypothetical protein
VADDHESVVHALAAVRVVEGDAVPRFRDAMVEDRARQHGGVAFVRPQMIAAEVGEEQDPDDAHQGEERPMTGQ